MYKIFDTQCCRYLHDDGLFKTLKECCEALIDYHSIDINMNYQKKLLKNNKILECWNDLSSYDWSLHYHNDIEIINFNKVKLI